MSNPSLSNTNHNGRPVLDQEAPGGLQHQLEDGVGPQQSQVRVHQPLADQQPDTDHPSWASIRRRLRLACTLDGADAQGVDIVRNDSHGEARLVTTPPLNRASMAPRSWGRDNQAPPQTPLRGQQASQVAGAKWRHTANRRRVTLLSLVLIQTYFATAFMADVLPYQGRQPMEIAILLLFSILFAWISAGFWTAMAGFVVLCRGGDPHAISATHAGDQPLPDAVRTAVVMPIYNENVARVFAGLQATYASVEQAGGIQHFDFFVLSDTSDPDTRIAETTAWLEFCRRVRGFGKVYYRWRQHRIKRKSGNVADFCRRWGKNYRYMVVLDADSVMSGACLMRLVRLMEANPGAGIIQTVPCAVGRDTLHARVQQFASRAYGPLFTAGLHFWQLGESHYWGHNAIIRVAPFIQHCALARLPGRGSLSGEILSHDFVEAALMRRAGWGVWIAYDLPGSYEEVPPNLVDELTRDRRWCQGNLMNFRLFLMRGVHPAHRAVFVTGVMAYLSAPLWFLLLLLSTALLAIHTLVVPEYFVTPYQLFPVWPEWRPEKAIALFCATATLLFLPKILSLVLIALRGATLFGGPLRLALSAIMEMVTSMLLAPVRMLFHTKFVLASLSGWGIQWKSPAREDSETSWSEALRRHGLHTLIGIIWAGAVFWLNPSYLWWLLPVTGALIMSIPLSVYSSRVSAGRACRRFGLLLIPEESEPPPEILRMQEEVARNPRPAGFHEAAWDPLVNAIACASVGGRRNQPEHIRSKHLAFVDSAVSGGIGALTSGQKTALMADAEMLSRLHFRLWEPAMAPVRTAG